MFEVWEEIKAGFQHDPDFRVLVLMLIALIGIGGFILYAGIFGG
jgi:hypothetical protein